jgi:hypothetical protein
MTEYKLPSLIGAAFILGSGFSAELGDLPTVKQLLPDLESFVRSARPGLMVDDELPIRSVEGFLSYLAASQPYLKEYENAENYGLFLRVSEWLLLHLFQKQQYALGQGPTPAWMQPLLSKWHRDRTPVITLNYDTLVESSVETERPDGIRYTAVYPVPVLPSQLVPDPAAIDPARPLTFRLINLHGSLNWFYSGAPSFFGEQIVDVTAVNQWNDATRTDIEEVRRRAPGRVPLVVPPTPSKSQYFENETVRALWAQARFELEQQTERLYLIGYSLPAEDLQMRSLISTAARDARLIPVNSDAGITDHLQELFPNADVDPTHCGDSDAIKNFVNRYT